MSELLFFDVPVYRLAKEKYYAAREAHVIKKMYPDYSKKQIKEFRNRNPESFERYKNHLEEKYGGPWQFNEIIGYIRLHFLGSQVRGEYYASNARRVVKTRTKILWRQSHKLAPEAFLPYPASNPEVLKTVLEYLNDCRKELKGRHIDSSKLEALGPHIDWTCFINNAQKTADAR